MTEESAVKMIKLDKIYFDTTTQPRVLMDMRTVEDYTAAMRDGDEFPPIEVVADAGDPEKRFWPWDGYHRIWAARNLGRKEILARVIIGTLQDAQWLSTSANKEHRALRRTNEDKKRSTLMALSHPKGREMSDAEIARHCGVDAKTVSKYRQSLESSLEIPKIDTRTVTRGGATYEMNTASIGKRKSAGQPQPVTASGVAREGAALAAVAEVAGVLPAQHQQPDSPAPASALPQAAIVQPWAQKQGKLRDVVCGNMLDIAATMEPGSVGTIITMPPTRYKPLEFPPDDREDCAIYGQVAQVAARLLKPNGTAMILVSPRELPYALREMTPHLTYRWTGAYLAPGGYGQAYFPRRVNNFWMCVVFFSNGEGLCDDIALQDLADQAMNLDSEIRVGWEQSLPGLAGVLAWTDPKNLILDPCCGNSKIGECALKMGRSFVGFEADPKRAEEVRQRLTFVAGEDV